LEIGGRHETLVGRFSDETAGDEGLGGSTPHRERGIPQALELVESAESPFETGEAFEIPSLRAGLRRLAKGLDGLLELARQPGTLSEELHDGEPFRLLLALRPEFQCLPASLRGVAVGVDRVRRVGG
jgi:hypothetical protein